MCGTEKEAEGERERLLGCGGLRASIRNCEAKRKRGFLLGGGKNGTEESNQKQKTKQTERESVRCAAFSILFFLLTVYRLSLLSPPTTSHKDSDDGGDRGSKESILGGHAHERKQMVSSRSRLWLSPHTVRFTDTHLSQRLCFGWCQSVPQPPPPLASAYSSFSFFFLKEVLCFIVLPVCLLRNGSSLLAPHHLFEHHKTRKKTYATYTTQKEEERKRCVCVYREFLFLSFLFCFARYTSFVCVYVLVSLETLFPFSHTNVEGERHLLRLMNCQRLRAFTHTHTH